MKDYHINIFYSEEDRGYVADIPDLACCSAFGETAEEALAAVLRAKAVWMEAAKAEGKPIPPPTFKPVIYQSSEEPA
jgi:predicted RNase H-like HicB family nuclease